MKTQTSKKSSKNRRIESGNAPSNLGENEIYQSPLAWWGKVQEESRTLAKWMALYEAVNLIADKAEERGKSIEDITIEHLDIADYVNSVEDQYLRHILKTEKHIDICYKDDADPEIKNIFPEVEVIFQ